MTPDETLRAAALALHWPHRYPARGVTDAEWERIIATGRPIHDCLDCGSREGDRAERAYVALPLREPLAAWLDRVATSYRALNRAADVVRAGDLASKFPASAEDIIREGPYDMEQALAVARTVLGEASP